MTKYAFHILFLLIYLDDDDDGDDDLSIYDDDDHNSFFFLLYIKINSEKLRNYYDHHLAQKSDGQ